jgi:LacI family transcriptional regulator
MEQTEKRIAIVDLARELGLSIGTVDRALHNRPGVNPMTRAKVLQMARTLGYRPNLAARALSSKRRMRIAAILPKDPYGFFARVGEGIMEAARAVETTGITVDAKECPWLASGDAEMIEAAVENGVSGLIIAPGAPEAVRGAIRRASRQRIPVVCVTTDAPGTERLTVIRADPGTSGSMAAELLGRVLQGTGVVAVITGSIQTATHAEILRGFQATLFTHFPSLRCAAVIEAHDNPDEAYRKTLDLFSGDKEVVGLYVSTSNSAAVLRALDELHRTGKTVVVTMDLFPEIAGRIREGAVLASIYQRPRNQGRQAFRALYRFLIEGVCPPAQSCFSPQIVLRSNLEFFFDALERPHPRGPTVTLPLLESCDFGGAVKSAIEHPDTAFDRHGHREVKSTLSKDEKRNEDVS